ncbi:MAG: BrnT family toxin [Gemmatimonas sp.]
MYPHEFAGFDWEDGNSEKYLTHGIGLDVVEALFLDGALLVAPDPYDGEERSRGIGRTVDGRGVFVVFTMREREGNRFIRPISARYTHDNELKRYEKEVPEFPE